MSELDLRPQRRPRRPRRFPLKPVLVVLAALLLFALGVAFGKALDDRPKPGGGQTIVRTLEPVTQQEP
ncbi:MAG: hypothetical protein U0R50_01105 [Gaiellales bacterium]